MRTSVIVVSYRPGDWLAPCLDSVRDQADEVVLVENGSPGGAVREAAAGRPVKLVSLPSNRGFAGGVNAGLSAVSGDLVALLNDDAVADPMWLESAAAALADPSVAVVSPKLLLAEQYAEVRLNDEPHFAPGDGRPLGRQLVEATVEGLDVLPGLVGGVHRLEQSRVDDGRHRQWRWTKGAKPFYVPVPAGVDVATLRINGAPVPVTWVGNVLNNAGSYLSTHGHGGDFAFETRDDGRFDGRTERFAATGAAMVARHETFARIGGMARGFFAYYEDFDWSWRARLAGLTCLYEPTGVVRHIRSATSGGEGAPLVRLLAARNRLLCLARNAPLGFFRDQLRVTWNGETIPGLHRSLARHLPVHLMAERPRLSRRWRESPAEILARWAGVDETWESDVEDDR
jgi:GT2 family glycosyltransferase